MQMLRDDEEVHFLNTSLSPIVRIQVLYRNIQAYTARLPRPRPTASPQTRPSPRRIHVHLVAPHI